MILAGDIGGTKIHLALFRREGGHFVKGPEEILATATAGSAGEVVRAFCEAQGVRPEAAALGVAGPVVGGTVRGANLPWPITQDEIVHSIGGGPVRLANDLEASAYGLAELEPADLVTLQAGVPEESGNRGLVSPGTGLGECVLLRHAGDWIPVASEGGHADFAPRTEEEVDLLRWLRATYGRASAERVVSGPGLANVFQWLRGTGRFDEDASWGDFDPATLPARIGTAGLAGHSTLAREALRVWTSVFGAESGNLALRGLTLGGVFLGGGIPARLLGALQERWFLDAFRDKEPHRSLLERVPVYVVTRATTPLLGAARLAERLLAA